MVSHGVPHAWNLARSAHGKSNTVSKGSVRRAGFVQVWVVCIAVVYQGRWQRSFSSAVQLLHNVRQPQISKKAFSSFFQ